MATEKRSGAVKKPAENKPPQQNPISKYFRETRGELRKVTWPTREESYRLTAIVIGVTIAFSVFLWTFDAIFSNSLNWLLRLIIGA
ncbi:MAG: preprotein translocase subunit SecE [Candidatus Promineifilaceae bacterium]